MKTIFRSLNFGLVLAAIFALGAVAGVAQDACADGPALEAAANDVRARFGAYGTQSFDEKQKTIDTGKAFVEKYGACPPAVDLAKYVTDNTPAMETGLKKARATAEKKAKIDRFNAAVASKNTDDILAAGKDLIAYNPEEFRAAELALASLGYDESYKTGKVGKYTEESLRWGRQAISDIESGKAFATYKVGGTYSFVNKDDALAWMNASVGYLTYLKNKKEGLPYLYKATQMTTSSTAKEVVLYEAIGDYYREEARNLTKEAIDLGNKIKANAAATQDEIKAANDTIDAKTALSFGYAERALDAYARAYKVSTVPAAQALVKKKFSEIYSFRYEKADGIDAWIASAVAKPFPNPMTTVEPVKIETTAPGGTAMNTPGNGVGAANGTGVGAANGTGVGAANGTGTTPAKAAPTTTTKPAATPAKPPVKKPIAKKAAAKKPVAKKRA